MTLALMIFTATCFVIARVLENVARVAALAPAPAPVNPRLADARAVIRDAPWMIAFPSLTLSLTILGLNLLGDGIRDVLDPRMRI